MRPALVLGLAAALAFPGLSNAAPAAPTITKPSQNATVGGASPTKVSIRGTAGPGTTIEVLDAGTVTLGTTTTSGSGSWRLDVALADGSHTVTAIATDAQGVASAPSNARTFTVDAVRPAITVTGPSTATVYQPGETPRIQGNATDDRTIHAIRLEYWRLNDLTLAALASCPDCGNGTSSSWSHRPSLPTGGFYEVKAYAYDAAGNKSPAGVTSFATSNVNESPIQTPGLPVTPDLPIPSLTSPGNRKTIPAANSPVNFGGRTEPGSIVHIEEEVAGLGTIAAVADSDGNGRWRTQIRLPSGRYGVRVHAFDEDGNVSELSRLITFEVDAQVPTLGSLPENTMLFLPLQPVRFEGRVLDDRRAAHVVLEYWLLDRLALRELASCPRCPSRSAVWQARPNLPNPGYYHVKVRAYDKAGNQSSIATVTLVKSA